jgi:hypothetical protein
MRISLLSAAGLALALTACAGGDLQPASTTQMQDPAVAAKPASRPLAATAQRQAVQRPPEADPLLVSQR